MSDSPQFLLTVEAAAKALGIGRTTMYDLIKAEEIRSVLIGRLRRVPLAALEQFVADLPDAAPDDSQAA